MSLGVDERSPSRAEASEMTEGWREWHGLTRTAATATGRQGENKAVFGLWVCLGPKKVSRVSFSTMAQKNIQMIPNQRTEIICNRLELLSNSENNVTETESAHVY